MLNPNERISCRILARASSDLLGKVVEDVVHSFGVRAAILAQGDILCFGFVLAEEAASPGELAIEAALTETPADAEESRCALPVHGEFTVYLRGRQPLRIGNESLLKGFTQEQHLVTASALLMVLEQDGPGYKEALVLRNRKGCAVACPEDAETVTLYFASLPPN